MMRDLIICISIFTAGAVGGYFFAFNADQDTSITVLVALFILMAVMFLVYMVYSGQTEALKTAQDELIKSLNTSIGAQAESLKQSLKQGTDYLQTATTAYHVEAQAYHIKKSAFVGLVKYHIYAAAIRQLHQTRNAEKVVKFVRKELEIMEKIETEKDNYELCGGRAHAEKQALDTLLGRIQNGAIEPKTAFFRCKSCASEFEVCPNCGGELERRFK